jgi:hypothetical protein
MINQLIHWRPQPDQEQKTKNKEKTPAHEILRTRQLGVTNQHEKK